MRGLLVGLGNPGPRYVGTRHNIGFDVLDAVAQQGGGSIERAEHGALTGRVRFGADEFLLAKPQSFMNLSGPVVQLISAFYKIPCGEILVVHDEVDLDFGRIKLKRGGGEAGHRGLLSISEALGTQEYLRLRFGVGKSEDTADHVLKRFHAEEREKLPTLIGEALDAIEKWVSLGFDKAASLVNGRAKGTDGI